MPYTVLANSYGVSVYDVYHFQGHMVHVVIGFAKAALDEKAPILGFILLCKHRCNGKNCKMSYFANNGVVSVLLLPCIRVFAAYTTNWLTVA